MISCKFRYSRILRLLFFLCLATAAILCFATDLRIALAVSLLLPLLIFLCSATEKKLTVKVVNKSGHPLPGYATRASAGMDIRACLSEPIVLEPGQKAFVPTGLYIELPAGYEAQIRPRSGLAAKNGLSVLNTPGTIDADYRGEIKVILINLSAESFTVLNGERIAQMVVARHETVLWKPAEELSSTDRGAGGFGHTGRQ